MPALTEIQRPQSQLSQKRGYRLTLSESARKKQQENTSLQEKCTFDNKVNTSVEDHRRILFQDRVQHHRSQDYFRDAIHSRSYSSCAGPSPLPAPTACPTHTHPLDGSHRLPRWISALGLWLTTKQKALFYQSFTRHLELLDPSKRNALDPLPHVSRCCHARTLSALQRQRRRLKLEEEYKTQERFIRLLERFAKITETWERIKNQSEALGMEHQNRLNNFKKFKDNYKDPAEILRKKREERERQEKERRKALKIEREKEQERQGIILPEIIYSDYDEEMRELLAAMTESSESVTENELESIDNTGLMVPEVSKEETEKPPSSSPQPVHEDVTKDTPRSPSVEEETVEEPPSIDEPTPVAESPQEDELPNESDESLKSQSSQYLAPPTLAALNTGDDMTLANGRMSPDETVGIMSGKAPVPLGLSNGVIPDTGIRVSSVQDRYHTGGQARLGNLKHGKQGGAWCPKKSDAKQYMEVDLGGTATIMQVATQGYPGDENVAPKDMRWVKSFTLSYSDDGKKWTPYTESGKVKVFEGNTDNNIVVLRSLSEPVEARFVRFQPKTWRNTIAMRAEVYGNFAEECPKTPSEPSDSPGPMSPEPEIMTPTPEPSPKHRSPSPKLTKTPTPPSWSLTPLHDEVDEEEEGSFVQFRCSPQRMTPLDVWEEEKVDGVVLLEQQKSIRIKGEKHLPKLRHKHKKPKPKKEKKKKHKKKHKTKLPDINTGLVDRKEESEEEDETGTPEPEEEEEGLRLPTPPLPEIPKRPEPSVLPPVKTRKTSMFADKPESPDTAERRRLARAQTDNSIRNELRRQELAEERRRKLTLLAEERKTRGLIDTDKDGSDFGRYAFDQESFLSKYCILNESQTNYYHRIFENFDEDNDGYLFPEELLEALECVNKNLLSDSHLKYIYRALEHCDCSLDSGADFKFFSVVAAFSQRIAALDEFAKVLISKLDFRELDYKLQRAKSLFKCYASEDTKTMSMEVLILELTTGRLGKSEKRQVLKILGQTTYLDFLDFLTYVPLFIYIHEQVLAHPLHT
ncbi:uncharacterized protein LOC5512447 [Nematostella vectensis]|uniref:uncharacterized protein LOC5512447 n=1 Tax=Nematostella vectensis TaxID=45351 RepID=UPI0020772F98|nr:uncharacterized protein LOC5512447 [Nematostella vectensis]